MGLQRITDMAASSPATGTELVEVSQLSATVHISAATISAAAADNSYNDSANGFVAAGFAVGDRVNVAGFTGSAANNIFAAIVTALTAGKMTIGGTDGDVIVDDAAGETVVITKWTTARMTTQAVADLGGGGGSATYPDFTGNGGRFLAVNSGETDVEWADVPITDWVRTTIVAVADQTDFAADYLPGYVQVFLNGVLLDDADYTAADGSMVILDTGAGAGDVVDIFGATSGTSRAPIGATVAVPTATSWRLRFPDSAKAALLGTDFGVGLSELKWLDDDLVTQLATGGTPIANLNYDGGAGAFALSELYNGSTASGDGWYASQHPSGSYNAWCGYTFATPVRPAAISFAPLNGYLDTLPLTVIVEFLDNDGFWQPIAKFYPANGANNTYQTFTLPTTYTKLPLSSGPNLWTGTGLAAIGDSITEQAPGGINWVVELRKTLGVSAGPVDGVSGSVMSSVAARIAALDLTYSDTLLIFMGTNDYGNSGGRVLGAFGDTGASNTFYGDLHAAINAAFTAKPSIRLVFATPIQRTDQTAANSQGHVLRDYVDAIIDSCGRYSVPVYDANRNGGFNSINFATFSADGLHPNSAGHIRFARGFAGFLIGL